MLLSFSLSVMRLLTNLLPGSASAMESRWSHISLFKSALLLILESSSSTPDVTVQHSGTVDGEGDGEREEILERETNLLAGEFFLASLS